MEMNERRCRALLVSSSEKFDGGMIPLLDGHGFSVKKVKSCSEARRASVEESFDLIVIITPLPDEFGSGLAEDIATGSGSGVLLLTKAEHYPELCAALCPCGVLIMQKPTSAAAISQSVVLLRATRERLRRMEQRAATVEEKMEEIRIVGRAKLLLIEKLKMTEPDAHRYIEKTAMDRCISKRAVAESIIKTYV